ncbi:unnamed protein product [Phytophthora fragariaefolia]|uniref:Unnamed protein product n=1 Tax=Phytophthora fragariaefolia TaxID=1490495 RepID=A0A9W6U913_9STRA|nr:unnamed protein product [Phytophthora fragariaefolia]
MREIDARVTGFDYTTFHAYTTEVEVDGRVWTLAIRYNTFYQFYTRLTALEKHFNVDFPPKGGLFFSPPPEERQEQLDDFLLSTLAYFDMRGHPRRMEALLGELLQIPEHMDVKDDEERTASEGSSVAEELLLDTPLPGHDEARDFSDVDSGRESDDHVEVQVEVHHEGKSEPQAPAADKPQALLQAEPELEDKPAAVEADEDKCEAEAASPKSESGDNTLATTQQDKELTGGSVAKNYIAMLRRQTLVNGAIQAAVVSMMKGNVEKAKAAKQDAPKADKVEQPTTAKVEEATEKQESVGAEKEASKSEDTALVVDTEEQPEVEVEKKPAAPVEEKSAAPLEPVKEKPAATPEPATAAVAEASVAVVEATEATEPVVFSADSPSEDGTVPATDPEKDVSALEPAPASVPEAEAEPSVESDQDSESSSDDAEGDAAPEPTKEAESENAVVSWFRRMGTFGPSAAEKEKEEQEAAAAAKKEQEEKEAAARAEAEAKAEAAAALARAEAAAKPEAEAAEAELLRAEQELNLRLQRYRHPVFFQGFNCDVGTSRYSLPPRVSDGIIV